MKKLLNILLITIILIGSVFFTSCEKAITTEELFAKHFYAEKLSEKTPEKYLVQYKFDEAAYSWPFSDIEIPEDTRTKGDKVVYFGDEYVLLAPTETTQVYQENVGTTGLFVCMDVERDGIKQRFCYDSETLEPLVWERSGSLNGFDSNRVDYEGAEKIALDYIETVLNEKYNKDIDIDKYVLVNDFNSEMDTAIAWRDCYKFIYQWEVNNIAAHVVTIYVDFHGNVIEWSALSTPDDELLKRIPNMTEAQYVELVSHHLTKAYANCGSNVLILNVQISKIGFGNITYSHGLGDYMIYLPVTYDVVDENGIYDIDMSNYFCFPVNDE